MDDIEALRRDATRWRTFVAREDLIADIVIALEVWGAVRNDDPESRIGTLTAEEIIDGAIEGAPPRSAKP